MSVYFDLTRCFSIRNVIANTVILRREGAQSRHCVRSQICQREHCHSGRNPKSEADGLSSITFGGYARVTARGPRP